MISINTIQCVRCYHSFSISKEGQGHILCPKCNQYTPYNFNTPKPYIYNDENDYKLEYGEKIWRNKKGQIHRNYDLPAIIYANGTQEWYKENKLHRDNDLPAIIDADGTQYWYKDDKRHRDNDKPAAISADGSQFWYKEGLLHRDNDLPAIIFSDGSKEWWKNNKKYLPSKKTSTKKSKY